MWCRAFGITTLCITLPVYNKGEWEVSDKHHRRPRSRFPPDYKGSKTRTPNGRNNISRVDQGCHRAYHKLFGNMTAPEIASMLSDCWIDPDYRLVAILKKGKDA